MSDTLCTRQGWLASPLNVGMLTSFPIKIAGLRQQQRQAASKGGSAEELWAQLAAA